MDIDNYLYMGVVGSGLLLIKIIIALIGIDGDSSDIHELSDDGSPMFMFLSISVWAGFLSGLGWVGYSFPEGSSTKLTFVVALSSGLLLAFLLHKSFKSLHKLDSYHIANSEEMVGNVTTVYLTIPENGVGSIWVKVNGIVDIHCARTEDHSAISSGTPIKVVKYKGGCYIVSKILPVVE